MCECERERESVCVCVRERERERDREREVWFIFLSAYQFLMDYLMLKFDSFTNAWLSSSLYFQYSFAIWKKCSSICQSSLVCIHLCNMKYFYLIKIICTQLISFKYFDLTLIIPFNNNYFCVPADQFLLNRDHFQTDLFDLQIEPEQVLQLQIWVVLEVMAKKGGSSHS